MVSVVPHTVAAVLNHRKRISSSEEPANQLAREQSLRSVVSYDRQSSNQSTSSESSQNFIIEEQNCLANESKKFFPSTMLSNTYQRWRRTFFRVNP